MPELEAETTNIDGIAELTDAESSILSPFRPRLLNAQTAWSQGFLKESGADYILNLQDFELRGMLQTDKVTIDPYRRWSAVVPVTMFGLKEALVMAEKGMGLREAFEEEYVNRYLPSVGKNGQSQRYGVYAFYPETLSLFQFPPLEWFRLALIASNGRLFEDPEMKLEWKEVRERFENSRVGIAGASVGSEIARTISMLMSPLQIDIGDPNSYKTINMNRVRMDVTDLVFPDAWLGSDYSIQGEKNKAISFAQRLARVNPFCRVNIYDQGITEENRARFVSQVNTVIEEVDLKDDKVEINKECRRQGKRYLLFSDSGSEVQWLIRPYDTNPDLPLTCFSDDSTLYHLSEKADRRKGGFVDFVDGLIGPEWRQSQEFCATLLGELPKIVKSIPQAGSTVSVAAGLAAEFVARMALGYEDFPEAGVVDMRRFQIRTFGKQIGELRK